LEEYALESYELLSEVVNIMLLADQQDKGKNLENAYQQRAEAVKSLLSDSVVLKDKLDEKQRELIELKKQFQTKGKELQDALWKEQTLEKKIEKLQKMEEKSNARIAEDSAKRQEQEKMYTEALDSIHKDVDHLTQENRLLKDKINKLEIAKESAKTERSDLPSVSAEITSVEVNALRSTIQYLRNELAKFKTHTLTELNLNPLSTSSIDNSESSAVGLVHCNKELLLLLKDVQSKRAAARVIDLSSPNPLQQFQLQNAALEGLQKRAQSLKQSIQSLSTNNVNSSESFTSFPPSSVTKVLQEKQVVHVGRLAIPGKTGTIGNRKVILDSSAFQEIHHLLAVF